MVGCLGYKRRILIAVAASALLAPAAGQARKRVVTPDWAALTADELDAHGAAALRKGAADDAIGAYAELVSRRPRDGAAQTLLALSYHLASGERAQSIDLALAGYEVASRVEPGRFWPSALAGRAAYGQARYGEALNHFARASIVKPDDARIMGAVAAAAYMAGDIGLAHLAAGRAVTLSGTEDPALLRLAAIAAAADGEAAAAAGYLARLTAASPEAAAGAAARIAQLRQTAAVDVVPPTDASTDPATETAALGPASPNQISLDVAIVLSQNTRRERSGINLLDGLSLQYGLGRVVTRGVNDAAGAREGDTYQRVITSTIGVPQLNYNLNLFNRGGQYYSVVARPQLTAYRGEQSEFFVGRSLKVAVNGINSGSLEQIDIGVELKVTPVEITATGTRVKIEAERSFLTSDQAGSFREALTTFRQKVVATAEIRFGETLLLSGLNETVDDSTFSKTPLVGDLPLVGNLFNERAKTQRRDSVIVLVTPAQPMALAGRPWARAEHAARLARLWGEVIDPGSNADAARIRLARTRMFTRMTASDVSMPFPDAAQAAAEMLGELILPRSQ